MSESIETIVKMMESLSTAEQLRLVDLVRNTIVDSRDEVKWDLLFKNKERSLIKAAKKAKQEISQGLAKPMDYDKL